MAENITVVMNKGDLQPLANDIKTLNGLSQSDLVTLNEMEKAVEDANDAIDSQENLIAQISAALEGKAASSGGSGGNAEPVLQEKTVSPSTSQQNVTPDSGYDGLSKVTVNAMPAGSVANPSISVSSSGLISATAAVDAGYVDGTDKTGTKQLTTQAAKTITPTKSSQTAVASGRYTTGAVTVAAIPSAYQDVTGVDAVAVDVVEGKKIVSSTGATVIGTNPYVKATTDTEVNSQATKLNELKTILQGKAAGSGSSGGSVETCIVTINKGTPDDAFGGDRGIYYIDSNQNHQFTTSYDAITVLKNSFIFVESSISVHLSGSEGTQLANGINLNDQAYGLFWIDNDIAIGVE